ncbi:MAG: ABC transporter permease [Macellibacteroides fermentans]|jgi:putative ABC transport system permease protein|uniref:ABC transporter permease n=1 Tax=Macellibacteroides fermentans TaxID=879969 RepID=UPI00352C05B7
MIKQHIKQAVQLLKENRLVSCISIIGTALSIAMVMVVVLLFQIQLSGYYPEYNRDRMLYIQGTEATSKNGTDTNRGGMSAEVVRECFYSLKTPEKVTAIYSEDLPISLPNKRLFKEYNVKYTDDGFWSIFNFRFITGKPFEKADFLSGIPKAVITDQTARELFGTTDVLGKNIVINFINYSITGVVKEVSRAARDSYAEAWIPYTTKDQLMSLQYADGVSGGFNVCILAKHSKDFASIRTELKQQTARYNEGKQLYKVGFAENPISRLDIAMGSEGFRKVDYKDFILETGSLVLFMLLVPALNLIGVTQASIQRRKSEVGLRKAFGATYSKLVSQILYENLVITLLGGALGLLFSFGLLNISKDFLLQNNTMINSDMLFQPGTFVATLFFVLLMNFLSAGIPALRIAKQPIVEALKGNE